MKKRQKSSYNNDFIVSDKTVVSVSHSIHRYICNRITIEKYKAWGTKIKSRYRREAQRTVTDQSK